MVKLLTPFDLSKDSQLINVAGTSPTNTDMRGTHIIGTQREWGALEYDPLLKIVSSSGCKIITPFDLSSNSQLISGSGISPTSTDMRGTGAIGGIREWGALEYDENLSDEYKFIPKIMII